MSPCPAPVDLALVSESFQRKLTPVVSSQGAAAGQTKATPARSVRRRATLQQGQALELLGHAVEYLVDSRMFLVDQRSEDSDRDAMQILMKMSRDVFSECPEVVSMWTRVAKRVRWHRVQRGDVLTQRG